MPTLRNLFIFIATSIACSVTASPVHAQNSRFDELANAPFNENRPANETAQMLRDELFFQRATQTYLWALPLINTLGMKNGSESVFGAGWGC